MSPWTIHSAKASSSVATRKLRRKLIDRESTTQELGFETLKYNVVAAQMSRGKNERTIAAALGGIANTLSRFAMDICLYRTYFTLGFFIVCPSGNLVTFFNSGSPMYYSKEQIRI